MMKFHEAIAWNLWDGEILKETLDENLVEKNEPERLGIWYLLISRHLSPWL